MLGGAACRAREHLMVCKLITQCNGGTQSHDGVNYSVMVVYRAIWRLHFVPQMGLLLAVLCEPWVRGSEWAQWNCATQRMEGEGVGGIRLGRPRIQHKTTS